MASFDEFLETYQTPAQTGRTLAQANEFANPQEAATALTTARKAGLPPEITDLDPIGFKRRQQQDENARILSYNDGLSSFIAENPVAGKAINDDYEKLDAFSKTLNAVKTGWHRGVIGEKLGLVGSQMASGLGGEEQVPELERRIAEQPEVQDGALHYVQAFSGMLGQMFVDASLAAGGAGVGAAGGAFLGGVGAIPGAVAGGTAGFAASMAAASAGRTFIESGKLRDENGQPLPLAHRQAASALVGVAAGALGMLGVRSNAAEIAAPILRDATMEAMKNPGFRDALTKGTAELARGGTTGAAMMGTLTAIQEGVLDAAKGLSDGDWKTIANDPKRRQEVVSAINKSMLEGAILVGGMHAPAVGYNFVADAARIRQSQADLKSLDNLIDAAAETNTATRSPEALGAFVRHSVGEQVIGFPAETINRFLAAKPGSLDFIPDLAKQLEQSNATGSDVVAPLADFLAHNPEMLKELREDVRLRPDSLTAKEATALEESPPDYAAIAYHGSPHVFDAFDISKIGTGEGAQSYGHGLYFAEAPGVAKSYQENLSDVKETVGGKTYDEGDAYHRAAKRVFDLQGDKQEAIAETKAEIKYYPDEPSFKDELKALQSDDLSSYERIRGEGALYQVRLKLDPERTILYDRPLNEQPKIVRDFFEKEGYTVEEGQQYNLDLGSILRNFELKLMNEVDADAKTGTLEASARAEASKRLREAGIQGIKYLDQDSRIGGRIEAEIKSLREEISHQEERIKLLTDEDGRVDNSVAKANEMVENARSEIRGLQGLITEKEAEIAGKKITHNYVVLDDKLVEITHRNGEPLLKQAAVEAGAREQRANWLDPLLRPDGDKPPLGMTEAEYAIYSKKLEQLAAATERKAEALATKEVTKRESETWKKNLAEITDETRTDLRYDPRILVDTYLRDRRIGNMEVPRDTWLRLDREAVETILGEKEQLPKGATLAKGGVHPDVLAEMFGYSSGQKMLEDLMALHRERQLLGLTPAKYFERMVSEEAARRMEERHGRLDENIAREAQEMVVQQAQTEVLGAELEFLAAKRGDGQLPLDRQSIEAATHELFADMPLVRAKDFQGAMRTVARMGRAAEMAWAKGDVNAAFQAKQRQYQAHIIAQGAKQLEKDYARFERLVARFREPVLASVDQAYTNYIQGIMAAIDMPSKRSLAELQGALKVPLAEFVSRKAGDGRELQVAAFLMDGTMPEKFSDFTTLEFHALHDSLTTLAHNGKEEKLIWRAGKRDELQALIDQARGVMNSEPIKTQPFNPNAWDSTKRFGRQLDVALVKMEQLFQWLDKNDPTGVFSSVFQNFAKAKYTEHDMLTDISAQVKRLKGDSKFHKKLEGFLDNAELRDWNTGELLKLNGRDLLAIMLHMGTESNFNKMTAKFEWGGMVRGWTRDEVERFVQKHATKEHWDLVQGIWDINENYFWPKIEEHSRRLAGIAPDKLEPRTIKTDFGDYQGGYAPIDRDPRWPHRGGDPGEGLFRETQFRNAIPKKDYTLARTEVAYPVWINFESVFNGMRESVHDLAYREPLMEGAKFLRSPAIREGIQQTFGKEYADSIQPWLEHMAKGKLMDDAALDGIHRLARFVRHRLVMVELVGRISTLMKHTMAATLDSVGEVGPAAFASSAMEVYGNVSNLPRNIKAIMERSGELRSRWHAWDRDINEMANRNLLGEASLRDKAAFALSYPLAMLDQFSAIPVFLAAERKYLEQGHEPEQAALMADTVVRNAHGAAGRPDLPPILRANEGVKLLTVAYTFFNHNYNRVRNIGRETIEGGREFAKGNPAEAFGHWYKAAALSLWYVILMGMYERWVTHSGPDEDKEESVGGWAAKGILHQLVGNLPAIRDMGMPILGYLDNKKLEPGGPFSSAAKALYDLVNTTGKYAKNEELSGAWWAHYTRGVGYGFGIPGSGQAAVTGQFLWDLDSGRQYADDLPSMLRGLALGKSHPHERMGR